MTLVKAGLGAAGGAILGMILWVAVGYFTGFQVGIIAIALGAAAGFGTLHVVGKSECDKATGVTAAVIAVLGVLCARFVVVYLNVEDHLGGAALHHVVTHLDVKNRIANEIIEERENAGKPVEWPNAASRSEGEEPEWPKDYPTDVIAATEKVWNEMPAAARQNKTVVLQAEQDRNEQEFQTTLKPQFRWEFFKSSFGLFDALWVFLAVGAAYKLGAGKDD
jgi:hypothetical protein